MLLAHISDLHVMEPPTYHLHMWNEASGLISHMQYIDQYDGPYPFAAQ